MIINKFPIPSQKKDLIKNPNDHVERYMTPQGKEIVTKVDTQEMNATHRQYLKKDGTPGKQTLTFKEVEK